VNITVLIRLSPDGCQHLVNNATYLPCQASRVRGYLVIEIVPKFDMMKKSHFIVEAFVDLPGAFQQLPKTGGKSETS
jgi:hypothetical protein